MVVAAILVALAILAVIAVIVINRVTTARPDRPLEGAEHDATPAHDRAADDDSTWTADRPADPGAEGMDPEVPGESAPGPRHDDERGV